MKRRNAARLSADQALNGVVAKCGISHGSPPFLARWRFLPSGALRPRPYPLGSFADRPEVDAFFDFGDLEDFADFDALADDFPDLRPGTTFISPEEVFGGGRLLFAAP
jgi:hypothetical protein